MGVGRRHVTSRCISVAHLVRMVFQRQLSIRLLDVLVRRRGAQAENAIRVQRGLFVVEQRGHGDGAGDGKLDVETRVKKAFATM